MTRDEHKQIVNKLMGMATPENQGAMSEILSELSEDYEKVLTDSESATARVSELTANNETLRSVNAKLFLKVGEVPKPEPQPSEPQGEPKPSITYESLFNDKGELI